MLIAIEKFTGKKRKARGLVGDDPSLQNLRKWVRVPPGLYRRKLWLRSSVWSERVAVNHCVTGSNPVEAVGEANGKEANTKIKGTDRGY